MSADSLQAYLEEHLSGATNNSPELIASLKAQWRKDYLSRYHSRYREEHVQISFRLSKSNYRRLTQKASSEGIKPTKYARRLVIDHLNNKNASNTSSLKLLVLSLLDIIEEAEFESVPVDGGLIQSKLELMLDQL